MQCGRREGAGAGVGLSCDCYFPAGVNSLLAGPVPSLHGNCREQPALRHLFQQEALGSQSACQVSNPGLCAAKWARAQGRGRAGHECPAGSEGLCQSSDLKQCLISLFRDPGDVQGLCGRWIFVSGEQEDVVSWAQGGFGDQDLLGCLG